MVRNITWALKWLGPKINLLINSPGGQRPRLQYAHGSLFEFPDQLAALDRALVINYHVSGSYTLLLLSYTTTIGPIFAMCVWPYFVHLLVVQSILYCYTVCSITYMMYMVCIQSLHAELLLFVEYCMTKLYYSALYTFACTFYCYTLRII